MVLLCPAFSSLLPFFFYGKLSGSKYSCVCALYAEKEQQCLAAGVACRYPADTVVLVMISETSLHTVERSVAIIRRAVLMSTFSSFGFGPLRTKQAVMLFSVQYRRISP